MQAQEAFSLVRWQCRWSSRSTTRFRRKGAHHENGRSISMNSAGRDATAPRPAAGAPGVAGALGRPRAAAARQPLLAYHGLLAPRGRWRSKIVPPPTPADRGRRPPQAPPLPLPSMFSGPAPARPAGRPAGVQGRARPPPPENQRVRLSYDRRRRRARGGGRRTSRGRNPAQSGPATGREARTQTRPGRPLLG